MSKITEFGTKIPSFKFHSTVYKLWDLKQIFFASVFSVKNTYEGCWEDYINCVHKALRITPGSVFNRLSYYYDKSIEYLPDVCCIVVE